MNNPFLVHALPLTQEELGVLYVALIVASTDPLVLNHRRYMHNLYRFTSKVKDLFGAPSLEQYEAILDGKAPDEQL